MESRADQNDGIAPLEGDGLAGDQDPRAVASSQGAFARRESEIHELVWIRRARGGVLQDLNRGVVADDHDADVAGSGRVDSALFDEDRSTGSSTSPKRGILCGAGCENVVGANEGVREALGDGSGRRRSEMCEDRADRQVSFQAAASSPSKARCEDEQMPSQKARVSQCIPLLVGISTVVIAFADLY